MVPPEATTPADPIVPAESTTPTEASGSSTASIAGIVKGMEEILPGVWHWTALNHDIDQEVSSYYLEDAGAVLDPLLGDEGVEMFGDWAVQQVILTNRLHGRDTETLVDHFGARVRVPEVGKSHFQGRPYEVETYAPGDEIAPGVRSHALGAIAPDDGVLHISAPTHPGALHFADGLLLRDGELALMPDQLMDDPEQVKATTWPRLRELLELDFDGLLFAHSDPIPSGGRDQLAAFASRYNA